MRTGTPAKNPVASASSLHAAHISMELRTMRRRNAMLFQAIHRIARQAYDESAESLRPPMHSLHSMAHLHLQRAASQNIMSVTARKTKRCSRYISSTSIIQPGCWLLLNSQHHYSSCIRIPHGACCLQDRLHLEPLLKSKAGKARQARLHQKAGLSHHQRCSA